MIELAAAAAADIDMSTIVVIGSSTTATVPGRPLASSVFTSRRHPGT